MVIKISFKLTAAIAWAIASTAMAFNSGDRVQCTGTGVSVRNSSCTAVGQVNSPTQGTVRSGPTTCTGCSSSWVNVNWDTGVTGNTCGDFVTLAPPFAPTLVGPGTGTSPGPTITGSSQTFQWNQSGGATNYGLFVRDLTTNTLVYNNPSVGNVTSIVVSGLAAGHQFRWNMQASNSAGTSSVSGYFYFQIEASCTAPTALTNDANPVSSTTATLNGIVTPRGCSTTVYFEYGLTTSYGTNTSNQTFTGTNSQLVGAGISGLTPNKTYHFRLRASNNGGTSLGGDMPFNTLAQPPAVTTTAASNVTSTGATLNGTVNPNGSSTTAHFEYGLTTNYGASTSNTAVGSGNSAVSVQAPTDPIQPGQTFHYRLVATNAGGTVYGNDVTFVTANGAPYALTNAATNITSNSFQGNATINANGLSTTAYFQYGLNTNYGNSNPPGTFTGSANQSVSATLNTNIQPNTTYHYRVVASSSAGTTYGNDVALTTSGGPTPTPTPTATPTPGGPTISSVSPNPVIGSTSSQPFTINGTTFSSTSVVNLRNLTTGTPYLNRTISSQTVSRLVINPIFGTEAHTWSVEVVNGTASSGQYQFQVQGPVATPRPDLIPSNVQASPTSIQIGNSIAVTVTISNPGPADAVASTTRVRINTSTSNTSSADVALGDIATPAIAAGSSKTISGSFIMPSAVTVGTHYAWVSVDNNNVTNQSDATNDYAHSPPVSISAAAGVQPPGVQISPGNQTINQGQSVTFTATTSGQPPFSYQWRRNGTAILNATTSAITTGNAGTYVVDVSNSSGTPVRSNASTLTVIADPTNAPPIPTGGSLTTFQAFDPAWPTVVITHGWQPTGDYSNIYPPVQWQADIAPLIKNRMASTQVNVLLFAWPEAYTHTHLKPFQAYAATDEEGAQLANLLQAKLGLAYDQKIHFIGHSFGAFVNAQAIRRLSYHVSQVSILDAPLIISPLTEFDLIRWLPKERVDYVDSYIASVRTDGLLFGGIIRGSAPNGGLEVATNHEGTHCYYTYTVGGTWVNDCQPITPLPSPTLGFNCSVLLGSPPPQPIARWTPPSIGFRSSSEFTSAATEFYGQVLQDTENIQGTIRDIFRLVTSGSAISSETRSRSQAQTSSGDSAIEFDLAIPADAQQLRFNFLFSQLGDGDWMTVSFNGEVLYNFLGRSFLGTNYEEAAIPVSGVAGQTGTLSVILHTASSLPAEVRVGNLHFGSSFVGVSALGNISTRLNVGTGDNALIGGFIITGTQPKKVIIRGIGPSLVNFGLSGVLADPVLELHDSSQVIGTNDDWQTNANKQEMIDRNVAPSDPKEAAILTTLNPGTYTAILRGTSNGTGIGTVEVYDLDQTVDSKLGNISTRGFVDTGDNVMIGGTIIIGTASSNVLIRAVGPSLTNAGVANALQDPNLELHDAQGGIIASNDNWMDSPNAAAGIAATGLQPSNIRESAILANLAPGAYTAIVRGSGNSTGVALVEAYQLQ